MILSIDKLLQLLAEGKSIGKIAELADTSEDEVIHILNDARQTLNKYDRAKSRKKVIIKKSDKDTDSDGRGKQDALSADIFEGAELNAVPWESTLTIYTDGASRGNPGPSGIGVVIYDKDDRQVGKVASYLGHATNNQAEYKAIIRALKIAIYFKTKVLKIRTDSELIVKQVKGEYKVSNKNIAQLYEEVQRLKKQINNCKIEHVTRNLNDKADYLAKKASQSIA
ncbi:MAG TPA: ribonuclease HI family protein [Spirochaetota bacterium]|nr:ribonuclease HI family protein [Spirochaetota bacterium]